MAVNLGLDGCLPCNIVLDREFVLPCRGSDPICSDTFQATFQLEREGPVRMRYDAPDAHCSPIRLHVSVDGTDVASSPFLPPEDRSLEIDIGSFPMGEHRLAVQAEIVLGGCSRSQLASSWGGKISLWSESCVPALNRRAALRAFPTPTPTPIPICDPVPRSGCRAATKSSLVIRTGIKMLWKFKDPVILSDELGDPVFGNTQFGLCVYDEVDDVPVLRAHTAVPAGGICPLNVPCWREKERKTIYKDIGHRQEGVEKIILKESRIIFKVTGFRGLPRPVDFVSFFNQDSTVTAQVVNSDGFCWEATFEREHVGRNMPHVYRASKR